MCLLSPEGVYYGTVCILHTGRSPSAGDLVPARLRRKGPASPVQRRLRRHPGFAGKDHKVCLKCICTKRVQRRSGSNATCCHPPCLPSARVVSGSLANAKPLSFPLCGSLFRVGSKPPPRLRGLVVGAIRAIPGASHHPKEPRRSNSGRASAPAQAGRRVGSRVRPAQARCARGGRSAVRIRPGTTNAWA